MKPLTLGVEEEFLVVDVETGALVPRSHQLLPEARTVLGEEVAPELNLCQIEVGTPVCTTLDEVREHLTRLRTGLHQAGEQLGVAAAATATHPFSWWQHQQVDLSNERYSRMDNTYQIVAREQVICGCHVHVGLGDGDLSVAVMNRVRPWLPVLLALSANSPFWQGIDTGYASYRLQVWQRWPTSGMPPDLGGRREYDELVRELQAIEAVEDATFLYWYVRPSARFPTLEFRVCDVCLDVEHTVAIAGLIRALAATTAEEVVAGRLAVLPKREVMEAAVWRAARYGLEGLLVSPLTWTPQPAPVVVDELLDHVSEALEAHGDAETVRAAVQDLVGGGNGATLQRRAFRRRGDGREVVAEVLGRTVPPLAGAGRSVGKPFA
jgi:carboxylate-amine ligase